MTNRGSRRLYRPWFWFLICAAALLTHRVARAQGTAVTYEDLRAGYWLNFEDFKTLYVSWRLDIQPSENAARRIADALKDETPEQRAAMLKGTGHREEQNELWTDRVAFQVRTPTLRAPDRDAPGRRFNFPRSAARKDNLMTDFSEIAVYNFNGNMSDGVKYWNGVLQGQPQGAVLSHLRDDAPGRALPPLALHPAVVSFTPHPFDAFFAGDFEQARVVGREELGGREALVVEKTVMVPNGRQRFQFLVEQAGQDINKLTLQEVQRAWIDMERGCLPLRMEKTTQLIYDGKTYPDVYGMGVTDVIETQKIEKVAGGGFYPTLIQESFYALDAREQKGMTISFQEMIGPGVPKRKTVSDGEQLWVTDAVDAQRDMTGLFGFEFPDSTVYFDFRTSKVVGKTYDTSKAGADAQRRTGQGGRLGRTARAALIWANVLLVLVLAVVVLVRRHRGFDGTKFK